MGVDISMYVEKRVGGSWVYVPEASGGNLCDDRDSVLFSLLEGYRANQRVPRLGFQKGVPVDASEHVRTEADWWNDNIYGHAFVTLRTLRDYDWRRLAATDPACYGKEHWFATEAIPRLEALGSPDEVRVVYWFDS